MNNVFNEIVTDLRARRLWPVMLGLVVALVAVPVLLAKSTHPSVATAGVPVAAAPTAALPVVSEDTAIPHGHLRGRSRDPFSGNAGAGGQVTATRSASGSSSSNGSSATHVTAGSSSVSGGGTSIAGTPKPAPASSTPPPIAPSPGAAKRISTMLGSGQVYRVALALSYPSGGLYTIDPLERLSVLPNHRQPLLVELGVLRGGRRVLFAVQPGAVVSGPGRCTPGPIDCQILSLAVGQNENLSAGSASGNNEVALFAVTSISAHTLGSSAAAFLARRHADQTGRDLLSASHQSALSLFRYDARVGVVRDLRNLSIGG